MQTFETLLSSRIDLLRVKIPAGDPECITEALDLITEDIYMGYIEDVVDENSEATLVLEALEGLVEIYYETEDELQYNGQNEGIRKRLKAEKELRSIFLNSKDPDSLFFDIINHPSIKTLMWRLQSNYYIQGADIEDVKQEIFIGIHYGLRSYNPEKGPILTFLEFCAYRNLITAVKSATRNKHSPLNQSLREGDVVHEHNEADSKSVSLEIHDKNSDGVVDLLIRKEDILSILRIIANVLTDNERKAIVGMLGGQSYEEISATHGVSVKTIDNAIQRARRKLKDSTSGI